MGPELRGGAAPELQGHMRLGADGDGSQVRPRPGAIVPSVEAQRRSPDPGDGGAAVVEGRRTMHASQGRPPKMCCPTGPRRRCAAGPPLPHESPPEQLNARRGREREE